MQIVFNFIKFVHYVSSPTVLGAEQLALVILEIIDVLVVGLRGIGVVVAVVKLSGVSLASGIETCVLSEWHHLCFKSLVAEGGIEFTIAVDHFNSV